jgi:N-acetylglucosamine-6-phosphate deacetylase
LRLGVQAAIVDGLRIEGDVRIEGGEVAEVGVTPGGGSGVAVPGFVDLHINGIAGIDFLGADEAGYREAAAALARTGVIAFQPTLVSSTLDRYRQALGCAAGARDALASAPVPRMIGVHLEGPFLEPRWAGAHDPDLLVAPDLDLARRLCEAGPVTMVTLAPELPGSLELVEQLVAAGIVVSCGHSNADATQAHAAFDHGARAITHVHNAHRRWRPRDPGLAGAALVRRGVFVQAIVDDVHLAPESAYGTLLATRERFCIVTDAIEAAGMGSGGYRLGGSDVVVAEGAARLPDGTLAGSIVTIDQAVRNLVASGASVGEACYAAASAPAKLLGRSDLGTLAPGTPANLTVLDEALEVRRTIIDGAEAFAA